MTDTVTGAALLQGIIDDPGDDAVRLIFADWLEEQGDPYAGVVRHQIANPAVSPTFVAGATVHLGRATLFAIPSGMELTYRRGFVESVVCPLDAWLAHGVAVAQAHPVTRVEAMDRTPAGEWGPRATGWRRSADGQVGDLPPDVFDFLEDGKLDSGPPTLYRWYDGPDDATADASRALILWARSQPLTPKGE